jgi:Protein of unknown function (DUF3224)
MGLNCLIGTLLILAHCTGTPELSSLRNVETQNVIQHAIGKFDVQVTPQQPDSEAARIANLGRMSIEKQFHGDLQATSNGEMLAAQTEVKGSAGYVAMERVVGVLRGRTGSFVLQHIGTMNRGVPEMSVTVLPDSGTGELKGITGKMTITIAPGGVHTFDFEYELP